MKDWSVTFRNLGYDWNFRVDLQRQSVRYSRPGVSITVFLDRGKASPVKTVMHAPEKPINVTGHDLVSDFERHASLAMHNKLNAYVRKILKPSDDQCG